VRRHRERWNVAHETATFRNLPMYSFTGDEKDMTDPHRPKLKHVIFLQKYKKQQSVCGEQQCDKCVFVNQPSGSTEMSF